MPKYFVQYHRVSTSEGIDRETYVPYIGSDIESKISERCEKCNVLLYLTKNFKKDKKMCDICYDMLDNEQESGSVHIVWTENQKFRVFRNIYIEYAKKINVKKTAKSSRWLS